MNLYRYLSFDGFKRILTDNQLYFANPFLDWNKNDNYEGFLYRFANEKNNPEWTKFLTKKDFEYAKEQIQNGCIRSQDRIDDVLDWFGMRCLCWCKTKCSDKMAKEYAADLCIEVESADLLQLHYQNKKVEGFDVRYGDYSIESVKCAFDIKQKIFNFTEILRIKEKSYEFENEYRSYVVLLDKNGRPIGNHKGILVDVDISQFVRVVYVNQKKVSEDTISKIKDLCAKFKIKINEWDTSCNER